MTSDNCEISYRIFKRDEKIRLHSLVGLKPLSYGIFISLHNRNLKSYSGSKLSGIFGALCILYSYNIAVKTVKPPRKHEHVKSLITVRLGFFVEFYKYLCIVGGRPYLRPNFIPHPDERIGPQWHVDAISALSAASSSASSQYRTGNSVHSYQISSVDVVFLGRPARLPLVAILSSHALIAWRPRDGLFWIPPFSQPPLQSFFDDAF